MHYQSALCALSMGSKSASIARLTEEIMKLWIQALSCTLLRHLGCCVCVCVCKCVSVSVCVRVRACA